MPIKQKAKRYDFEYESPDGDTLNISYLKNEGREYVELIKYAKESPDTEHIVEKAVYDLEALFDIVDELRKVTRQHQSKQPRQSQIPAPSVTDHRATQIESQVQDSMENYDSDVEPVQSFSPQEGEPSDKDYLEASSGVNPYGLDNVGSTPDDVKAEGEGLEGDINRRINNKQVDEEKKIKRSGAEGFV